MGLYGERVGLFSIINDSKEQAARTESQIKILIRPMYSNPPLSGPRIASKILADPKLVKQWYSSIEILAVFVYNFSNFYEWHLQPILGTLR